MSKILHLSDIHFGRNYNEYNVDGVFDRKELILEELIECISKMDKKPEHDNNFNCSSSLIVGSLSLSFISL